MTTTHRDMGTSLVVASTGEVLPAAQPFDMATYLADLKGDRHLAQQKALAAVYDAACHALIGENDVQKEGARSFKKKSAWRKLARHFNISTEIVRVEKEVLNGEFCATVTVRAVAPWGQHAEEVGACSTDEATGRRTISTADAIATAATRATNRAVSNLIAMGEVSAEEVGDRPSRDAAPRVRPVADGQKGYGTPEPQHGEQASGKDDTAPRAAQSDVQACPKCGGPMWDDRIGKRNPKAPDFKCRNKATCDGVIWPPKKGDVAATPSRPPEPPLIDEAEWEEIPF
jgi:hypothetical protein